LAGEAIAMGVAKFNFGTNLKQAYLAAVRKALNAYAEPMSPHEFLGMGGDKDILAAGRDAVQKKAGELIVKYGFAGRAPSEVLAVAKSGLTPKGSGRARLATSVASA
jgi:fructose/tagatose bisphosphate aldolase